jgi:hypothetical protein
MIKKSSILKFVFFISVLMSFYSCLKDDTQLTAYGDVLIKSVQSGDSTFYGLYYYVYSYDKMANATVYREGVNTKITLDSIDGRYTFIHDPDFVEYTTSKPIRAKYIYNVVFENGEQFETFDILDSASLRPVVIKECKFDQEEGKLIIDWEENSLADQYIVNLENEKNEIVFQCDAMSANQTYLCIYLSSYGWLANKQPSGGEKFKVVITAYQYETVPSVFDLQSISVSESEFVEWIINY